MSSFETSRVVHGSSQPLRDFLTPLLQSWRWDTMLARGGIRAQRAGKAIAPLTLDTALNAGDVVFIDDAYGTTWMELRRQASADARDLVFCPQRQDDSFLNNQVAALIADQTAVDVPLSVQFLNDFVKQLTPLGAHPIRHLFLVSHANPFGEISLPVRPKRDANDFTSNITWDSMKAAIADGSLRLDTKAPYPTLLPRPENGKGERLPCAVIVRGCSTGVHTNLLQKIQEAFGSLVDMVVMPKFYDAADFITAPSPIPKAPPTKTASVEYFMHRFIVSSKTPLNRQGVLDLFKKAKLTDWLGSPVPDGDWEKYVPANPGLNVPTVALPMPITGRSQPATFRAHFDGSPMTPMTQLMSQSAKPTPAEIRKFMMARWIGLPMFQDPDWPFWERMGLPSLEAFGDFWTYEVDSGTKRPDKSTWPVHGIRYSWEVRTPLVDQGTMICRYQPITEPGTPSNNIDYNDDRIFGRYAHIPAHFAQTI